jgi:gamma-glutamyltranspeptidase/glutathione hydrolase
VKALKKHRHSAATYLVDGERAPACGELFRNQRLADTMRALADAVERDDKKSAKAAADVFYRGFVANEIVEFSRANGGLLSHADFADHRSSVVEPVSSSYRGYDVWQIPPPAQGIATLQILNIVEQFDVESMGVGSVDWLHLFIEAKKLAFADRAKLYADPSFATIPTQTLISKDYAKQRAKSIDMTKATPIEGEHTAHNVDNYVRHHTFFQ